MSKRRGFTFVELLIVLAIIVIATAMIAPRYGDAINRYRAEAAAKRIASDFAFAQTKARTLSTSRSVVFYVSSNYYKIPNEADLNNPANTYSVYLSTQPYFVSISTASFGGNGSVTFNGYGVPSSAGSVTISAGSTTKTISIDADTGATTIQ